MSMISIFCIFSCVIFISLAQRNCDNLGILFYENLACKPLAFDKSTKCPTEFNCPSLNKIRKRCSTKEAETSIPNFDVSCRGCSCQDNGNVFCLIQTICAEKYGIGLSEGCYRTYDLKNCCSNGENCDNDTFHCEFEGNTYKEGERMYSQHSCSICLCTKDFTGKIKSPFCIPRVCNVELTYNKNPDKCAPFYGSDQDLKNGILCCPDRLICPDGSEHIFGCPRSDKQCFFGNMALKVGQKIKKGTEYWNPGNVICECKIPPLLTCLPETILFTT